VAHHHKITARALISFIYQLNVEFIMSGTKIVMLYLVFGLAIGGAGSYFIMNNQLLITKAYYEGQLDQVQDALEITTSEYSAEVSTLEEFIDEIQDAIKSLQLLNNQYYSEIETLEETIESLEDEIWNQDKEIQYFQNEVENILDMDVMQHYEWEYGWSDWEWDLSIPLDLYWDYHQRSRPVFWSDWVSMCKDSGDDYYINRLVSSFETIASNEGFSEYETVEYVITFVQSLPYTVDDETTPWNEYPRYPVETLFDRGGDCEDTSILTATILYEMGYDVALLLLEDDNHCAIGIKGGEGVYGTYYNHNGVKYYYVETTGDGWGIGEFPDFDSGTAQIYPLNDY
jgi:hypothetical protein